MKPYITIVYVYYNTPDEMVASIDSLPVGIGKLSYEIIIIDNASSKTIPKKITGKKIKVIHNKENVGFGKAANKGIREAKGDFVLVLNPDTIIKKNSIFLMIKEMEKDEKIGLAGPLLQDVQGNHLPSAGGIPLLPKAIILYSLLNKLFPNNRISRNFWSQPLRKKNKQEVPAVSGACMLFRKYVFEKIGGFDNRFFMYFEEADIALRVHNAGYKIVFVSRAKVTHLISSSNKNKELIRSRFEQSRFKFFQKNHGTYPALIAEGLIRILSGEYLLLLLIILLSSLLNLYRINELMMFYGDFARDMLAARDMLVTGNIPLVGIPSSVVWLHQGPLSIYMIAFAFSLGNYHPIAPSVLYALLGIASTLLVYLLGKNFFTQRVGFIAAALYATSPLIVINARIPYHTAPIPFFTLLYFCTLWKVLNGKVNYVLPSFFLLGLLIQLELSNFVLIVVTMLVLWFYRIKITRTIALFSAGGFLLGILPFIIHDITHKFIQTGGFLLWIVNRIRLFFGLTSSGNSTTQHVGDAILTIWSEYVRMVFPLSQWVVLIISALCIIAFFKNKEKFSRHKPNGFFVICAWLFIPLFGFLIHARPGTAYFPVLFPAVMLFLSYLTLQLIKNTNFLILLIIVTMFCNSTYLLANNYFLATHNSQRIPELFGYTYGITWRLQEDAVNFILNDAKGRPIEIKGGGFLNQFATSVDTYKYLSVWKGVVTVKNANNTYIIYQNIKEIPKNEKVIFSNNFIFVVKK